MDRFEKMKEEARAILENGSGSHDWEHTERVMNMCLHLSGPEKADTEILMAAALLHDIGRHEQDRARGKISHEIVSVRMAGPILRKYGYGEDAINRILHCIATHR